MFLQFVALLPDLVPELIAELGKISRRELVSVVFIGGGACGHPASIYSGGGHPVTKLSLKDKYREDIQIKELARDLHPSKAIGPQHHQTSVRQRLVI